MLIFPKSVNSVALWRYQNIAVCLCIPTNQTQQYWFCQWLEFGGEVTICFVIIFASLFGDIKNTFQLIPSHLNLNPKLK